MSKIIDAYLRDVRSKLNHLPIRERDAVLEEIGQHLKTETKRLRQEQPTLSADEADLQATHAFGDPDELGVAYGAGGGVVNRTSGELLLDVAVLSSRAAGRGVKTTLKWTGIICGGILAIALVLLVIGLAFTGTMIHTFQDDIRENIPRPLYDYHNSWDAMEPHTATESDTFALREGTREFIFSVQIRPDTTAEFGCARVVLTAPDDSTAYDSGVDCDPVDRSLTLNQEGTWSVEYIYVAYSGSVDVSAIYFEQVERD